MTDTRHLTGSITGRMSFANFSLWWLPYKNASLLDIYGMEHQTGSMIWPHQLVTRFLWRWWCSIYHRTSIATYTHVQSSLTISPAFSKYKMRVFNVSVDFPFFQHVCLSWHPETLQMTSLFPLSLHFFQFLQSLSYRIQSNIIDN